MRERYPLIWDLVNRKTRLTQVLGRAQRWLSGVDLVHPPAWAMSSAFDRSAREAAGMCWSMSTGLSART